MSTALAVPDKSLIDQAFGLALAVPEVEGAREELDALRAARRTLLPVEEVSRIKLEERIMKLTETVERGGFNEPMLPMEPLGWRWKNGLPKLALLSIGMGPSFTIKAQMDNQGSISHDVSPELPWQLETQYKDVVELAKSYCVRHRSSRTFSFTFDGIIPTSVKCSIIEAQQSRRFEGLYMLAEAPAEAWKVESVKGISRRQAAAEWAAVNLDPLILGFAQGALWVIDKFDLTTLEQYVSDEFTQKALPSGS